MRGSQFAKQASALIALARERSPHPVVLASNQDNAAYLAVDG